MSLCSSECSLDRELEHACTAGKLEDVRRLNALCVHRVHTDDRMKWSELPLGRAALNADEASVREILSTHCALFMQKETKNNKYRHKHV